MEQHINVNRDTAHLGAEGYFLKTLDKLECVFDFRDKLEKLVKRS